MLFVWVCVFVSAFTGRFVTGQSPPPLPPGSPQEVPVVQGLNYFLEMLLGRTTCKTGNTAAELKCTFSVN
ncbi:hypothetical protein FQN60_010557, partial [Etheostoma spectabile]